MRIILPPLLLTAIWLFAALARCDPPPFGPQDLEDYDFGRHGIYPEIKYKTTDIVGAHIIRSKWDQRCDNGMHLFFCPRGMILGHKGPMILDPKGQMVWHSELWPIAYGLTVQRYRGEDYLTFWSGNDQVVGHGSGYYFMLDKHYDLFKTVAAYGVNLTGDLHEFKITEEGTALLTVYDQLPWDLTPYGRPRNQYIWDCLFQEIDLETGALIFEWRATEHFTFEDCYNPVRGTGDLRNAWDWFHINSVEKTPWAWPPDRQGYLISSRYSHSLSFIDARNGDVKWQLGGKNNSFHDLSDGRATDFCWQHDARWHDDGRTISLFDNHAYFANQTVGASGLKLEVDVGKMTAKVLMEAKHPNGYISESQGSCQILPNGNMVLGYGSAAAITEFSPTGELLCDMAFGALHYRKDHKFSPSAVMSYRSYKHHWKGYPSELPKAVFEDGLMYVSWNGATEVRWWMLEGSNGMGNTAGEWDFVGQTKKEGFESNITCDEFKYKMFRMSALDTNSKPLGIWVVYAGGEVKDLPMPEEPAFNSVLLVVFGALVALLVLAIFRRKSEIASLFTRRVSPPWYLAEKVGLLRESLIDSASSA